ncbi:hypothetical protein PV327_008155 [Microctonus hyperodae]|uniref:Uncharacterized protein n=1 Tax=Microctonus hyperodae TaxID=165561 RepID=A0AA39F2J5_MICHY|nr:hypothetical protein PV327_008155 [Microctonus hyperodae]
MSQSSIQIKHSWHSLHGNFTYAIMKPYSASFVDESLPDVEFNIFCDVSNHNSCKVFLSKTPCKPANATVQMLIKYHDEKDEIHEYPWVDDCTFECDFPILDGREKARKHDSPHFISYTFICCITWRGFKEPSQSKLCEERLTKSITIDNALKILERASLYGVPQLIETLISFMVDEKLEIVSLDDFEDFYRRKSELLLDFIIRSILDY